MADGQDKKETQVESHPFIQEEILSNSKKKSRIKRFCFSIIRTLVLAIIFGLVGSFVFCLTRPYFAERFGKDVKKKPISLIEQTPTPKPVRPSAPASTPTGTVSPTAVPTTPEPGHEVTIQQYSAYYSLLSSLATKVNRSIVTVTGVINGIDMFNNPSERTDSTYGVIIDNDGEELLILTSLKKLENANKVRIIFSDNSAKEAELCGYDKEIGLAVLTVPLEGLPEATINSFETAELGESYTMGAGTPILALGSPNGYMYSMETGMVCSRAFDKYITDYKLEVFYTNLNNYTNGEGIITNLNGDIIGVISHEFKDERNKEINTVVGISKLKPLIQTMMNREKRIYFGITGNELTEDYKNKTGIETGIYVMEVLAKSPAFNAGVQSGDVIIKVDDVDIASMSSFFNCINTYEDKETVKVSVIRTSRDNMNMTLEVQLDVKGTSVKK